MVEKKATVLELLERYGKRLTNIESLLTLQKNVLNIDEVSLLTSLSKSTIYKFTHTGMIPHYKQAKHLFFNKEEIEAWLQENRGFDANEIEKKASTYVSLNKEGLR